MNYTRLVAPKAAQATRLPGRRLGRLAATILWAIINTALLFAEQLADLLAPILLLVGGIWWALPRALAALTLDGPANDILLQVRSHVPTAVDFGGTIYSAHSLIADGLLCIAAVALCRTLTRLAADVLLERP